MVPSSAICGNKLVLLRLANNPFLAADMQLYMSRHWCPRVLGAQNSAFHTSVQCTVSSGLRRAQWSPFVPQVGTLRTLDTGTLALLIEPFQHRTAALHPPGQQH